VNLHAGNAQYVVHQRLGAGGMGVVHLGTMISPAGRRRVAIKRLIDHGAPDAEARARMVAEAQLVFQLTHGSICQVLDLAENEQGTFIVMELVDGVDLRTLTRSLRTQGRFLDLGSALHIAREIARALDYAHRRVGEDGRRLWLVHGDVTPQNVLLSREGEVKLADFGVARARGTLAPGNQVAGGTPGFMAPETSTGGGDSRSDVYALGITLYVVLSGKSPERGLELEELERVNPAVTGQIVRIIQRATARRPEDRFASAAELEEALSIPFSRIVPPFTPSALGRLVTREAGAARLVPEDPRGTTSLVSIAGASVASSALGHGDRSAMDSQPDTRPQRRQGSSSDARPASSDQRLPVSQPRRTREVAAGGARRAATVGGLATLAMVLALGGWWRLRPTQTPAPPRVAAVPPPLALADPPPVPAEVAPALAVEAAKPEQPSAPAPVLANKRADAPRDRIRSRRTARRPLPGASRSRSRRSAISR
jgi:serine/threonine protein kinase